MLDPRDRPYSPCAQLYGRPWSVDNPRSIRLPAVYKAPQLDSIWAEVIAEHGLTRREMATTSRRQPIARARQAFMWTAWEVRDAHGARRYSLPQIARFIAMKTGSDRPMDHTTVLHGWRRHRGRIREATLQRVAAETAASVAIHGAA